MPPDKEPNRDHCTLPGLDSAGGDNGAVGVSEWLLQRRCVGGRPIRRLGVLGNLVHQFCQQALQIGTRLEQTERTAAARLVFGRRSIHTRLPCALGRLGHLQLAALGRFRETVGQRGEELFLRAVGAVPGGRLQLVGQTVFEPRASDKGDAARGMMYMVVMYDHNGSYGNWAFKWLNETKIPSTPQDLQTLLNWSKQDPPDKWEVERNNYIASLQQNRNPFIDHPEYLKYINLYDMSKLNPVFSPEPTSEVFNFFAVANGNSITVNWTNPSGRQLPSGYLLQAFNLDNYFIPADGDVYPDSTDLSTGKAVLNIPNTATQSYTFNNLSPN